MSMWTDGIWQAMKIAVAGASWSAAVVLTIVGTARPALADRAMLWVALSLSVAMTTTFSLIITRAQWEVVEDVRAEAQAGLSQIKRDR